MAECSKVLLLYSFVVKNYRLEGEERLKAIEQCIVHLPPAHRDNLTYLVNFLAELLQYQEHTS